ncbi:MAG: right-handed parallel beta-helix repeat-containing protein [Kiritimatiellae bacterium]|nr:right-handed parallel beta-helix repeat-containing protein [Kiritimatiellia bacterium]
MKKTMLIAGLMGAGAALAADAVKVSDFGYDAADSTEYIRAALTSGARRVTLDRQAGPWYTLPLKMPSNVELVLEPSVELVAKRGAFRGKRDYLLELRNVTNVVIRGSAGSALRMWKCDYQKPPYEKSQWRYALRIAACTNVLVDGLHLLESGGDGIGVNGRNITICNCVCDRNHRQGMSVFSAENLLVENCVFSNTMGTPPQAGVDIEPNSADERLRNVVFRNCRSFGNTGIGFEVYLAQLRRRSGPVTITFDGCSAWDNRSETSLNCGKAAGDWVYGHVRYVNCMFRPTHGRAVTLSSVVAGSVDVTFEGTVISNATDKAAVSAGVSDPVYGRPDGIDFGNLAVVGDAPWFTSGGVGAGVVRNVRGRVTVIGTDGSRRVETIDEPWIAANIPPFDGDRALPPRVGLPSADRVQAMDKFDGETVSLAPVAILGGTPLVFLADRPGECRFAARQIVVAHGVKPTEQDLAIQPVGGGRVVKLRAPGAKTEEFSFKARKRGFYRISFPKAHTRFYFEKSNVPIALDVSGARGWIAQVGQRPFQLTFASSANPCTFVARGSSHYHFAVDVRDATDQVLGASKLVDGPFIVHGGCREGFCTANFSRAATPHYGFIYLDLYGAPPFLFLSPDKMWK